MGHKRTGGLLAILAVALVTVGLVFGASTTAYASSIEKWNEDKTFDSDTEIKVPVSVENDVTVTIAEGKTVTVSVGINTQEHTLTVTGKGTLTVKGEDGPVGVNDDGATGGPGGIGLSAITGDVIVDGGATFLCTGGAGGKGGRGTTTPGSGGDGGAGLDGNLTVKGGTAKLAGGMGGEIGPQPSDDTEGPAAGKQGKAVTGKITANVIQTSDDGENYEALEGTSTEAPYVIATSEVEPEPTPATNQEMYRLYNPNSGEHFYTANKAERDNVIAAGWKDEGVGWVAPAEGDPVYRLYNEFGGEHHYTTSANERDTLIGLGWKDEGIGWKTADTDGVPLYRQYNPNAFACNHNYTADKNERDTLLGLGWKDEGIGWYGVRPSK